MTIHRTKIPEQWNYFLALEEDVRAIARWIEFSKKNERVYSIELARLLMTASAEVDVVAKATCSIFEPAVDPKNIHQYQRIIKRAAPAIVRAEASLPRYGMKFKPWSNWSKSDNPPAWWQANNKVKHQRAEHFAQANLKNVLNAVGGLLLLLLVYYGQTMDYITPTPEIYMPNTFAMYEGPALRLLVPD